LIEVPTQVATSHEVYVYGRHIADDNWLARGIDSKTQIKPFCDFERRKELDGGAVVEECCYAMKGSSPQLRVKAIDAVVIFGAAGQGVFRIGHAI
jgi:hypothetical protein